MSGAPDWMSPQQVICRARLEGGRAYLGCAAPGSNPHIGYDEPEELAAWDDGFYAKELESLKARQAQLRDEVKFVDARISALEGGAS